VEQADVLDERVQQLRAGRDLARQQDYENVTPVTLRDDGATVRFSGFDTNKRQDTSTSQRKALRLPAAWIDDDLKLVRVINARLDN